MDVRPLLPPSTVCDEKKLQKIVKVLMDQVERGIDFQGNSYSLFQTAIVLEDKVRERTRRLELALRDLERSNRQLSIAKEQTETAQIRLMEALESLSEGFIQFDHWDRLILCNTKFIEFWSWGECDIREVARPGVRFRDISRWTVENGIVLDIDGDKDDWLRARLFRHMNPTDLMVVHLANGRWLQIRERQTRDGGTVGIYTDITEVKLGEERRREQELAEKSILLQSTLDSLPQGVSVFDKHLRLIAWNDRFIEMLELPDWLVSRGTSVYDYLNYRRERGDFGNNAEKAIAERIRQMRACRAMKTEQTLPNGTVVEVRRDPMPGGGFVTTYTDITDRQIAAAQLREAMEGLERRVDERTAELIDVNRKLRQEILDRAAVENALLLAKAEAEKANVGKTKFLAAAGHDLLQPLNAARLFVAAIADRPLGDKERDFVSQIDRALSSVEALLGALLDISKLDAGAVTSEKGDFVINDLLSSLGCEYTPVAREAGLELVVVPSSAVVRTDATLLARVLRNFISNAIRYTPRGRVLLGCRRRWGIVRIEVWDTGLGIPASATEEIFEEFRQLNHREHRNEKSFGLGLAIVKSICRVLNHPVGVRSRLGEGSVFFIDVPVGSLPQILSQRRVEKIASPDKLAQAFAVVIEDQDSILDGMHALLTGWGCRVLSAVDGRTALLDLARGTGPPDIVIADYHLAGGLTGVDAIQEVRSVHGPAIPAVVITADRSCEVTETVRRRGFHLMRKPLKPAKLRALISHLLSEKRTHPAGVKQGKAPVN